MIIRMVRGDTARFDVEVSSPDPDFDVRLEEVFFQVKKALSDQGPALIRKSTHNGGVVPIDQKTVRVVLFREDTEQLENLTWIYPFSVTLKEQTGDISTIVTGELHVRRNIPL